MRPPKNFQFYHCPLYFAPGEGTDDEEICSSPAKSVFPHDLPSSIHDPLEVCLKQQVRASLPILESFYSDLCVLTEELLKLRENHDHIDATVRSEKWRPFQDTIKIILGDCGQDPGNNLLVDRVCNSKSVRSPVLRPRSMQYWASSSVTSSEKLFPEAWGISPFSPVLPSTYLLSDPEMNKNYARMVP
jgi:hypothetical protein